MLEIGNRLRAAALKSSTLRRYAHALALIVPLCTSGLHQARAEEDDALVAAARALAIEGVKLAQNDQCPEAIDKLERAEKLRHAPVVAAHLGECYVKLGRLVEGVERLRSVLRDPPPPNSSEAVEAAYSNSKELLEATRPKLAALSVAIYSAPGSEPIVTIDGRPLPAALLGARHPVDPGEHLVRASAPGHLPASRRIELSAGEEQAVALTLSVDPAAVNPKESPAADSGGSAKRRPTEASAPQPAAARDSARRGPNHLPAYIAWGAGVVALGVGVGFGAAALGNRADLRELCPDKTCGRAQRDLLDTARMNGTISTIGCAAALAGAATGSLLFIMLGGEEKPTRTAGLRGQIGLASADVALDF